MRHLNPDPTAGIPHTERMGAARRDYGFPAAVPLHEIGIAKAAGGFRIGGELQSGGNIGRLAGVYGTGEWGVVCWEDGTTTTETLSELEPMCPQCRQPESSDCVHVATLYFPDPTPWPRANRQSGKADPNPRRQE